MTWGECTKAYLINKIMSNMQKYCNKNIFSKLNCCLLFKLVIIDSSCNLCQFLYQLQLMLSLELLNQDKHVFSSN